MNIHYYRNDLPVVRVFDKNIDAACRELTRRVNRLKTKFELKLRRENPSKGDRKRTKLRLAERRRTRRELKLKGETK